MLLQALQSAFPVWRHVDVESLGAEVMGKPFAQRSVGVQDEETFHLLTTIPQVGGILASAGFLSFNTNLVTDVTLLSTTNGTEEERFSRVKPNYFPAIVLELLFPRSGMAYSLHHSTHDARTGFGEET